MTQIPIQTKRFIGLISGAPTKVPIGSTLYDYATGIMYITYDGTNWAEKDNIVKLAEEDGTFIDLPAELQAIVTATGLVETAVGDVETALAAMGYAFSIGGVNFNDYTKIKTLWLPSTCDDNSHVNMKCGATNYQVPSNAVFIALRVTASIYGVGTLGIFGWSETEGGDIGANQDILSVSCGLSATGFMNEVLGVFPADKWVKARTDHNTSEMYANSALYGVEVPNGS